MPFDTPHTVSPSLWVLAWRRLRSDRVAMISLAIVVAFLVMMLLSATGLIAKDWGVESGVNYAPPSFLGDDLESGAAGGVAPAAAPKISDEPTPVDIKDPLADALAQIRAERGGATLPAGAESSGVVDPFGRRHGGDSRQGCASGDGRCARETLPFGGDKWGRDVLKKTIKGSETSIFVGLAAALVATFIGAALGAIAGYYGKWVDDFFNWFYNVFTAMPPLLLILAVAAVMHSKGMLTIILILGLTGWTGVFRLIRGEYLKHKGANMCRLPMRSARRMRGGYSCTFFRTSATSCSCNSRFSRWRSSSSR